MKRSIFLISFILFVLLFFIEFSKSQNDDPIEGKSDWEQTTLKIAKNAKKRMNEKKAKIMKELKQKLEKMEFSEKEIKDFINGFGQDESSKSILKTEEKYQNFLLQTMSTFKNYAEVKTGTPGLSFDNPALSCLDIIKKAKKDHLPNDGIYWLNPSGINFPKETIQGFCDMKNGGWLLVAKLGRIIKLSDIIVNSIFSSSIDQKKLSDEKTVSKINDNDLIHIKLDRLNKYGLKYIIKIKLSEYKYIYLKPQKDSLLCNTERILTGRCKLKPWIMTTYQNLPTDKIKWEKAKTQFSLSNLNRNNVMIYISQSI